MKTLITLMLAVSIAGCQSTGDKTKITSVESKGDKVSYAIGVNIGMNVKRLKQDSVAINTDVLYRGILDAMGADSAKKLMTETEMQAAMTSLQEELTGRKTAAVKATGEKNRLEGEKFLAENGKKPGVVTLPSGLQYQVIVEGKGKIPRKDQTVTAHYEGTLIDGTIFDSSIKRGEPVDFQVDRVIPGWTEALQKMKVGSKWKLFIPSNLAYGERSASEKIGPNSTLIFDVELIAIKDMPKAH